MKWAFLTEDETGQKFRCGTCGKTLTEAFCLEQDDEEYKILEDRFGDVANWTVGECCFGGYCLSPTEFSEVLIDPPRVEEHGSF